MDDFIFWLNDSMAASQPVALGAAALWGVVSVLLSPCHLGTIPLVVAYVGSAEAGQPPSTGRAAALSFSFAGGMLLALALLGVLVTGAGLVVAGAGRITNYVIAGVFLLAGLNLIGLLPMPWLGLSVARSKKKGRLAAATVGLVLGIGLSPCTFAFLAPVLAVAFGSATAAPVFAVSLLLVFGLGHCGVIGLAGTSAGAVQRYLDWSGGSRSMIWFKATCGVLLLLSAASLLYSA